MTIQEKTPSKKFFELLDQIVVNETSTKKCFDEAVEHERKRGMTDELIAWYMHDYLRDKINKKTLERWIKPLKELEDSSSEKETVSQNDDNNDIEHEEAEIIVTTEGSQTSIPSDDSNSKPEEEEPTELDLLKIENAQLKDAMHQMEQFKPGTLFLGTKSEEEIQEIKDQLASGTTVIKSENLLDDDTVFQYLRDRSKETGNVIVIDRVGAGALVQSLTQYKRAFKVCELFLRVIE
jgi:hypothetical protein